MGTINPEEARKIKRFLKELSAHITVAGGDISERKLEEYPLKELLAVMLPNGLELFVDNKNLKDEIRAQVLSNQV